MEEFLKLFNVRDILLHILNTVILFIAIRFLVYKPVRKFLNARTERVENDLSQAAEKREQATALLHDAEAEKKAMDASFAAMQSESAMRAQQTGEQLIADAKAQAQQIVDKAHEDAASIKAAAQEEMQAQALAMAVEIAEKLIGRELAVRDNETLAREFLTKVG